MPIIACSHPGGRFEMCYEDQGAGSPTLLFVHGFGCAKEDWQPQIDALAEHSRALTCDLIGHGASTSAAGRCRVEYLGTDVANLLERLELERVHLVGHSMGCRVVLQAYAEAPERVAGLTFVDGSWLGAGNPAELETEFANVLDREGYATVIGRLFEQMFLPGDGGSHRAVIMSRAKHLEAEVGRSLICSMVAFDAARTRTILQSLCASPIPVMAIQSTYLNQDRERAVLAPGHSTPWLDLLSECLPQARIEVVRGVGHFSMLEAPQTVNQLIESFARAIPPP